MFVYCDGPISDAPVLEMRVLFASCEFGVRHWVAIRVEVSRGCGDSLRISEWYY